MINDSIVGELVLTLDQRDRLQRLENRYQDEYDRALAEDTLTAGERAIRLRLLSDARQKEIGTIMTGKQYGQWLGLLKRHEEAEERKAALKK